jgi:calcineurin-like phosphoesterase family protein
MDEAMIENWNKLVKPNDFIYHLGDFGFGDCLSIFRRLRGRKYLIKGNHDRNPTLKFDWTWVKDTAMITVNNEYIWLSHYAHRSWNRSFHGSWHLFGHAHGKLGPYAGSMDIGVDGHDFKPWNFDELAPIIEHLQVIWGIKEPVY